MRKRKKKESKTQEGKKGKDKYTGKPIQTDTLRKTT
jgi:hypothetical protein